MAKGCDFTSRSLTGATLAADGYAFCCRYVLNAPSGTLDKEMSLSEIKEKTAHNVRIVSNWEWQAVPVNSRATGKDHATRCKTRLAALGVPTWAPVYYSIDTGANAHDYDAYAQGWRDVYPADQLGVYGCGALFRQLKTDGFVRYAWQSMSRSFPGNHLPGKPLEWDHRGADIIQTGSGTINAHSVDFDTATIANYGGWLLGEADPNAPTPPEENVALTSDDVTLLLTTNLGASGPNVGQALQGTFQKVSALTPGTAPSGPVTLDPASVAAVAAAVVDLLDARLAN